MYKHLRGKSDTDFILDKIYLDNIHYNIKNFSETQLSFHPMPAKKPQSFQTQTHQPSKFILIRNTYIYNSYTYYKTF